MCRPQLNVKRKTQKHTTEITEWAVDYKIGGLLTNWCVFSDKLIVHTVCVCLFRRAEELV